MVTRSFAHIFLGIFFIVTCAPCVASPVAENNEKNGIGAKIENFCLKIFNKDVVEKAKGLFSDQNREKVCNWCKDYPGTGILGVSTLWTCAFRKWRLPFWVGLAGLGVGGIVFLHNKEYQNTFLERPITCVQNYFEKTTQPELSSNDK